MTRIENEKAGGKFAVGYKYTVLGASFDAQTKTLTLSFPQYIFPDGYKSGKLQRCYTEVEHGIVLSGYKKTTPQFIGDTEQWLKQAEIIDAPSIPIVTEFLRKYGFQYDKRTRTFMKSPSNKVSLKVSGYWEKTKTLSLSYGEGESGFIVENGIVKPYGDVMNLLSVCSKVFGETYEIRDILRELGFKWDKTQKEWVR